MDTNGSTDMPEPRHPRAHDIHRKFAVWRGPDDQVVCGIEPPSRDAEGERQPRDGRADEVNSESTADSESRHRQRPKDANAASAGAAGGSHGAASRDLGPPASARNAEPVHAFFDLRFLGNAGTRWGWQLPLFPGFYPPLPPVDDADVPDGLDDTLPEGDFPGQLLLDLGL